MSEKKVAKRSTVIALGIVCILLAVGIVGSLFYYTNIINGKNADYARLNSADQALNQAYQNYTSSHLYNNDNFNALNSAYQNYTSSHLYNNDEYNALNSNYANYTATHSYSNSQVSSSQVDVINYEATHTHSDSEYNSLNSAYNNYTATHTQSDVNYNSLQSAYNSYMSTHTHSDSDYNSLNNQTNALMAPQVINVGLGAFDNRSQPPSLQVIGYVCNVGVNVAFNVKIHVVAYQGVVMAIDTYITLPNIPGKAAIPVNSPCYYVGAALTPDSWTMTPQCTASP